MQAREFRVMGWVENIGPGRFRAMAAAVPRARTTGPAHSDMRAKPASSRRAAYDELGLLVHAVASTVMARGDRIVGSNVARDR
jgi:hypothetical protein